MKDLSLNNTTLKLRAENGGIRLAEAEDLPALRRIYAAAREFMAKHGNAAQWGSNFPPDELLLSHISRRELYVFEEISIGNLHAAFALVRGEDPAYRKIDGSWLSSSPYLTIHRVASDGTARGVFSAIVKFAEKSARICGRTRTKKTRQCAPRLSKTDFLSEAKSVFPTVRPALRMKNFK